MISIEDVEFCEICQCNPCDCDDYFIKVRKEQYNKVYLTSSHLSKSSILKICKPV
jgi:hypothetical protein